MMNKINLNLEHCFGITKLSQELTFEGENVVLIYAPNGLMKTSFAKTLKLYGQGKTNQVKDVVADIAGSIDIKDEYGNVIMYQIAKKLILRHQIISHRSSLTVY